MQITYNERCYVGDGCQERNPTGLSHFGIDVVKEMNRSGWWSISPTSATHGARRPRCPRACRSHWRGGPAEPRSATTTDPACRRPGAYRSLPKPFRRDGKTVHVRGYLRHIDHVVDLAA
jgi:hypothetical protein